MWLDNNTLFSSYLSGVCTRGHTLTRMRIARACENMKQATAEASAFDMSDEDARAFMDEFSHDDCIWMKEFDGVDEWDAAGLVSRLGRFREWLREWGAWPSSATLEAMERAVRRVSSVAGDAAVLLSICASVRGVVDVLWWEARMLHAVLAGRNRGRAFASLVYKNACICIVRFFFFRAYACMRFRGVQ